MLSFTAKIGLTFVLFSHTCLKINFMAKIGLAQAVVILTNIILENIYKNIFLLLFIDLML